MSTLHVKNRYLKKIIICLFVRRMPTSAVDIPDLDEVRTTKYFARNYHCGKQEVRSIQLQGKNTRLLDEYVVLYS